MNLDYDNKHCRIAAEMIGIDIGSLDFEFVERLNSIAKLVSNSGGKLVSRQVIATVIVNWREQLKSKEERL